MVGLGDIGYSTHFLWWAELIYVCPAYGGLDWYSTFHVFPMAGWPCIVHSWWACYRLEATCI